MMKLFGALLILLIVNNNTWATNSDSIKSNILFISVKGNYGTAMKSNDFVRGQNANNEAIDQFKEFSALFGLQTIGKEEWEQLHKMPAYGIGLSVIRINNEAEMGKPFSAYGFYHGVIHRWSKSALRYDVELGLAFNWKCFDLQSNPYNIAIGSKITSRICLGLDYELLIAKNCMLTFGGNFTHFSNGAIRKPNKGINFVSPFISFSYLFDNHELKPLVTDIKKEQHHEVQISVGYGIKQEENVLWQNPELTSVYEKLQKYHVFTLKTNYMRQYCQKGKWGGGVNICFDEWRGSEIRIDANGKARKVLSHCSHEPIIGLFLSHELLISKVGIVTDLGGNVYMSYSHVEYQNRKILFERLGVKYYFPYNIFAGVNVFANGVKANIIEWNMGYALQWHKRSVDR